MSRSWSAWVVASATVGALVVVACSSDSGGSGGASGGGAGGGAGGWDAGTDGTAGATGGTAGTAGTGGATGGAGGTAGTAGTAGTGGEPGDAGDAGAADFLGAKCKSDADCAAGVCLLPDGNDFYGFAGPANGYCTIDCTDYANDYTLPDPCAALAPNASCVPIAQTGTTVSRAVCFAGCTLGEPPVDGIDNVLDLNKCHGRRDQACVQPTDDQGNPVGIPYCEPLCQKDKDCSAVGRKCDPRLKLCVDDAHLTQGAPLGASCADWVSSNGDAGTACAGVCLALRKDSNGTGTDPDNIAYFCSERCVFNTIDGCGYYNTPKGGVCLLAGDNTGKSDEAYCLQMCDVDADCAAYGAAHENVYCDPIGVDNGWGRGFCLFRYGQAEAGAFPCADGQKNNDETDIDCGGSCSKCDNGKACLQPSDCKSGACTDANDAGALVCTP
jgi:hypothetical protein